ncbi:MAG: cytidine deaminase [Eubacteriales bacterium]|nr:cytidine deaminase [Eubacteriales bacterium]
MTEEKRRELIVSAFSAQKKAYAPYSGFLVGAALLTADGRIYEGCNIENASYGASNCAERTAFFRAVYEGERDFRAIAIVGKPNNAEKFDYCAPCGICRQVMAEFCTPETFKIILAKSEEEYQIYRLEELLPLGFTGSALNT